MVGKGKTRTRAAARVKAGAAAKVKPRSSAEVKAVKKSVKAPMVLDFNSPAEVRARLRGYDSLEEARAETELFDFSSEYWQIEDD